MPLPPAPDNDSTPWWRLPIVWLVIGGPTAGGGGELRHPALALSHPDPVLSAPPAASASEMPAVQGRNHAATPRP